jgi:hypothetical protein
MVLASAVLALCLPAIAAAQWGRYPDSRYPDNRYPDNRSYGRYDDRYLRDSVHRLDRLAKDFERDMDRALDRSRVNGTQREDLINAEAHSFRRAAGDLKSRIGDGRDLNRSAAEASRVLQQAQRLDRMARPRWFDSRVASEWSQIQEELRIIADAYGLGYNDIYRGGRNGDYRRQDNGRSNTNNDWWRRIPFPR